MRKLKPVTIRRDFFKKRDNTVLTWIGMAGVLINTRGTIILIDPLITVINKDKRVISETDQGLEFAIRLPIYAKDIPRVDAVLYTHADSDHFGIPTACVLERHKPVFICTPPVLNQLKELGVSKSRLVDATLNSTLKIKNAEVLVTPAYHCYPTSPWGPKDCVGYVVKTLDGNIWHPGDTKMLKELKKIKDIDILFFDVAKVMFHLGPGGSTKLAKSSGASTLCAYHYGTYKMPPGTWGNCDPDNAYRYLGKLSDRYIKPNPGEILRLPAKENRK